MYLADRLKLYLSQINVLFELKCKLRIVHSLFNYKVYHSSGGSIKSHLYYQIYYVESRGVFLSYIDDFQ